MIMHAVFFIQAERRQAVPAAGESGATCRGANAAVSCQQVGGARHPVESTPKRAESHCNHCEELFLFFFFSFLSTDLMVLWGFAVEPEGVDLELGQPKETCGGYFAWAHQGGVRCQLEVGFFPHVSALSPL